MFIVLSGRYFRSLTQEPWSNSNPLAAQQSPLPIVPWLLKDTRLLEESGPGSTLSYQIAFSASPAAHPTGGVGADRV